MRNTIIRNTLIGLFAFSAFVAHSQNVGINTTGAAANASAILDLNTGNTGHVGFLAPQAALLSLADVVTIPAPATGLIVYNTSAAVGNGVGYYYWNGAAWTVIATTGGDWLLTGNSGAAPATNWIGTNDANALEFKVDAQKAGFLDYLAANGNAFFGFEAGNANTGTFNTGIGYQALTTNTTGSNNTGVGYGALFANSTASNNTATGYDALYHTTASNNTATGYYALVTNSAGVDNTIMGYEANWISTNANDNTAIGYFALNNTLTSFNTALGYQSGKTNSTGTLNTYLGYDADANAAAYFNSTAVGAEAYIGATNAMVLGSINGINTSAADVNVGIGTSTPTQKLNVNNGNILISQGAIGADLATVGQLQLQGTSTGISTIQAGAQGATNYNYTLPTTAPAAGDVLAVTAYAAPNVSLQWQVEPNALLGVKIISTTQAATVFDPGTTYIVFKVIGGGGAGGGCLFTAPTCISTTGGPAEMAGAGGGAGGYSEGFLTGITGGVSTYAVVIGAGGIGQSTCSPTLTASGGTTTLTIVGPATVITSPGGTVGGSLESPESLATFSNLLGGVGGLPVNAGAINIQGATGGFASTDQSGVFAAESGPGANSVFEGGGSGFDMRVTQAQTGNPANAYGSGGGGGVYPGVSVAGSSCTGGNGSSGVVIIYEYK